MANKNPITTIDTGKYPDYQIPSKYSESKLYLSITTALSDDTGWKMSLIHSVLLDGTNINPSRTDDPKRLRIGKDQTCADLNESQFAIISRITRIRDGGEVQPPSINYNVCFEIEDNNQFEIIDSFDATWDQKKIAKFFCKITFKI